MRDFSLEKTIPIKIMLFNRSETRIEIKQFKFSFNMITLVTDARDHLTAELNQNISFSKVQFFLQEILNESIFCEKAHSELLQQQFGVYENNVVVLPNLNKDTIITALHRKVNSICADNTQVFTVKICDVDLDLSYTYTCMDPDDCQFDELPKKEEWVEPLSYWEDPWWDRNDQLTWDPAAASEDEWTKLRADNFDTVNIDTCTAFDEIEHHMIHMFQDSLVKAGLAEPKEGEIIEVDFENKRAKNQIEKWKPKLV